MRKRVTVLVKLIGMVLVGVLMVGVAGYAGWVGLQKVDRAQTAILVATGLVATLGYDLVTNVAQGMVFGSVPVTLAASALPAGQHLVSNLVLFVLLGNFLFPWLRRHPLGLADAR